MPHSADENKLWVSSLIKEINPFSVLDIGAGSGTYGKICKNLNVSKIDCVEVWKPYIEEFSLNNIYENIFIEDVRNFNNFNYDLIIFGDVLEHMTKEEALNVYKKSLSSSKFVIFSMPIINYPQGHEHGNPYEEHVVDDWNHEDIMSFFPNIFKHKTFSITGTYVGKL
jgi:2-polyprenyl-3-methyl-5-hydroxy-6-metoxy-1,4-benzoquinol methylase